MAVGSAKTQSVKLPGVTGLGRQASLTGRCGLLVGAVVAVKGAGQARKVGGGGLRANNFRRRACQAYIQAPHSCHGLSEKGRKHFPGLCLVQR